MCRRIIAKQVDQIVDLHNSSLVLLFNQLGTRELKIKMMEIDLVE